MGCGASSHGRDALVPAETDGSNVTQLPVPLPPPAPAAEQANAPRKDLSRQTTDPALHASKSTLIGDLLEARDTYGLWSAARVVATFQHHEHGPLLCVHFEGWPVQWLMWISRKHDLKRLRALPEDFEDFTGENEEGHDSVGDSGVHTEES